MFPRFRQYHGSPICRLKVVKNSRFTVFLHKITSADPEGTYPHDHGCDFFSLGLRGSYVEELFDDPMDQSKVRKVKRGTARAHVMRNSQAHRILSLSRDNVYTLFITWNFAHRPAWAYGPEGPMTVGEMAMKMGIANINDLKKS